MADPMSERHWLAIKRYVTNVRATYRDLRYAGRPMQHLVPLWDEAERLRTELDETTAARDGDLVRQLAEAWRERDAARAEVERLRAELDTERRRNHYQRAEQAEKRCAHAVAEAARLATHRDRLAEQVAIVEKFAAARAEYITAINNCHPDNAHDYHRWQGHAESRRQLSKQLGLPVAWPADYEQGSEAAT